MCKLAGVSLSIKTRSTKIVSVCETEIGLYDLASVGLASDAFGISLMYEIRKLSVSRRKCFWLLSEAFTKVLNAFENK